MPLVKLIVFHIAASATGKKVKRQRTKAPTISGLLDRAETLLVATDLRNWLAIRNREANIFVVG